MTQLEIGKKYMFDPKKSKKNKVMNVFASPIRHYKPFPEEDGGVVKLVGTMTPQRQYVLWVEEDPYAVVAKDGMGQKKHILVQRVRICTPFSDDNKLTFKMTEMIFEYPGPLVLVCSVLDSVAQKEFEDLFYGTTFQEVMADLWGDD